MKKYNLALVGTFDCENYGDLMFPVIFRKQIEKRLPLNSLFLFSPNSCDMPLIPEKIRVYSVEELERVHREYKLDAIIFGGGDLVRFDNDIAPAENYIPSNTSYDLAVYTAIAAAKMNIPIIWNAPGVPFSFSAGESEIVKELVDNLLDYCSVRDNASVDFINRCGVSGRVNMVPDTVFSISDLIERDNGFADISKEFDFLCDDYVVFQSMPNYSDEYINLVASALREISKQIGAKIVFLPIGYVHNDNQFIKKFLSVQNDPEFFSFDRKLNVFETTSVLANAKAFIGSSLHGNIVSNSYGVPNIGLDLANIVKLAGFFKLQGREKYCIKDVTNLVTVFSEVINSPAFSKIDENKSLIAEHFDSVAKIIENGTSTQKEIKRIFDLSYRHLPAYDEKSENNILLERISSMENRCDELLKEKLEVENKYKSISKKYAKVNNSYIEAINAYTEIRNSFYWRITAFPRSITSRLKSVLLKFIKIPIASEWEKLCPYERWMRYNDPTPRDLRRQRKTKFKISPKISILVPMYKTPVNFFTELVEYMINQTYGNWELCLEDGSPERNAEIEKICGRDKRIKYNYTGNNLGIAGNTNEALKHATGDYIALLDHDDLLPVNCLFEVVKAINEDPDVEFIYTDEDKITTTDKPRFEPHFKPDFAIDTLRATNYICHFSVFRRDIMEKLGGERREYDGAQDYDLILRMAETAKNIKHIPKVLYHWRVHDLSTSKAGADAKPYAFEAGIKAVSDHLKRVGLDGEVTHGATLGTYKTDYKVIGRPRVTILIPNCNQAKTLKTCIDSVLNLTTYDNYEIVIIENNSTEKSVFSYYEQIEKDNRVKVLYYTEKGFNYSKIINFGVKNTTGEYIVQLNNDTELITPDWLEKMLGMCQRDDVGCVGVKLYYPDNTIQHAGVIFGMGGVAGHIFSGLDKDCHGYFARESMIQNLSVVTAACMMSKRSVYEQVGYMEERLAVAFNDVDFCMKVIKSGRLIIYNPFVELMHYESKSRGSENTPEKKKRFNGEIDYFMEKWSAELKEGDRYYNKNLRLDNYGCTIREEKV